MGQITFNTIGIICAVWLGLLLAVACWTDLRRRRIPNQLVLVGALTAIALHTMLPKGAGLFSDAPGGLGFLTAFGGFIVGQCVMMPLYLLRAMGAGDVKLMAMVGAFLGPLAVVGALLMTFLAGGVLAMVVVLWNRSLRATLSNIYLMLANAISNAVSGHGAQIPPPPVSASNLPYALAIAAGTLAQVLLERNGHGILS